MTKVEQEVLNDRDISTYLWRKVSTGVFQCSTIDPAEQITDTFLGTTQQTKRSMSYTSMRCHNHYQQVDSDG